MKKIVLTLSTLLLSTSLWAMPSTGGQNNNMISNVVMLGGFLVIFYFMLIRPQTKRAKEHQQLLSNLAPDDEVLINGGIVGKIVKVSEQFLVVSIADNVNISVQKQSITTLLPKGTLKTI